MKVAVALGGVLVDACADLQDHVDLVSPAGPVNYTHRDGTPYPEAKRRS